MKQKNTNKYMFLVIVVITLLAALGVFFYSDNENEGEGGELIVKVVLIPKGMDEANDFWFNVVEGAQMAAAENHIELTVLAPASEMEVDRQNAMIEEAIAMQPNAIVLAPNSYEGTTPYAKKIEEAGIKLIVLDSVMAEEMGSSVVATDNLEGGIKMGSYMKPYLEDDSVIGIIGHVKGASTATEREMGIREALGEYEEKIVDVEFCDSNYSKAYNLTVQMLEEHPDINVIFGLNEYSAVGAGRAVRDLELSDKIDMVGFDSSMEEVQMLEAGVFDAIVVQKPLNMGYIGVTMAYQAALGQEIPDNVDSGSVLITKETIYTEENQKLLFRFKETN